MSKSWESKVFLYSCGVTPVYCYRNAHSTRPHILQQMEYGGRIRMEFPNQHLNVSNTRSTRLAFVSDLVDVFN